MGEFEKSHDSDSSGGELGSMEDRHLAPAASENVEIVGAMEIVRMIKS